MLIQFHVETLEDIPKELFRVTAGPISNIIASILCSICNEIQRYMLTFSERTDRDSLQVLKIEKGIITLNERDFCCQRVLHESFVLHDIYSDNENSYNRNGTCLGLVNVKKTSRFHGQMIFSRAKSSSPNCNSLGSLLLICSPVSFPLSWRKFYNINRK